MGLQDRFVAFQVLMLVPLPPTSFAPFTWSVTLTELAV